MLRDVIRTARHRLSVPARGWQRLVLLAAVALIVAACVSGDQAGDRILDRGLGQEPESMDPHLARTTQAHTVQRDLFEGLVSYSADGELVPGAAQRWDISGDGLEYVFHLREDARWSNGDALVAGDFLFSLRRLVDPATAAFYAESLSAIVNAPQIVAGDAAPDTLGVEAPDDRTLVIRLSRNLPYFLDLLTHPSAFPIHPASFRQYGGQFSRPGNLVSNGAYRLDDWTLGASIELRRNEQYWNAGATAIERVRYHMIQDPSVELNRYRAGELDTTSSVPTESFAAVRRQFANQLRIAPALSVYFYGINLSHEALGGNPELRQALSMAIDRETLVEQVIGRGEAPAYSFVPPGVNNYAAPQLPFASLDENERHAEARRLFEAAGYGPGRLPELELRYNTSETHRRIAVAIQEMWHDVLGFEVRLINEEFRALVANIQAREITQLFRLSWNGDYNDAHSFLTLFESDNPSNMFGYSNPDFDRLMQQAAEQTDLDHRRLFLEEAERELLSDHVVIPLYFPVSKHLVSPRVGGWQDNILDYHYSQHLYFTGID